MKWTLLQSALWSVNCPVVQTKFANQAFSAVLTLSRALVRNEHKSPNHPNTTTMKNAFLRGLVVFGLGFGMMALSACSEETDTPPADDPPAVDMPMDDAPADDMAMDDSTAATEEPMAEEEPMEEGADEAASEEEAAH